MALIDGSLSLPSTCLDRWHGKPSVADGGGRLEMTWRGGEGLSMVRRQ